MKKTYMNPNMVIVKIATQQMLAYSGDTSQATSGDAGSAAGRGFDFDYDEEE